MASADRHEIEATAARARDALRRHQFADALRLAVDALAQVPGDSELRLIAAHSLLSQKRPKGAKREALAVLRGDPRNIEAHRILVDAACLGGDVARARAYLAKLCELDPTDEHASALLVRLSTHTPPELPDASLPCLASIDRFVATIAASMARPRRRRESTGSLATGDHVPDGGSFIDPFSGETFFTSEEMKAARAASVVTELPQSPPPAMAPEPEPRPQDVARAPSRDATFTSEARRKHKRDPGPPARQVDALPTRELPLDSGVNDEPSEWERTVTRPAPFSQSPWEVEQAAPTVIEQHEDRLFKPRRIRDGESSSDDPDDDAKTRVRLPSATPPPVHEPPDVPDLLALIPAPTNEDATDITPAEQTAVHHGVQDVWAGEARPLATPPPAKTRRVPLRWLVFGLAMVVVGGGMATGYLWYRAEKLIAQHWQRFSTEVFEGTPESYRTARDIAARIADLSRAQAEAALAARAFASAALAVEIGEDYLAEAEAAVRSTARTPTVWRAAAETLLLFIRDPDAAGELLAEHLATYPDSAVLYYLKGRVREAQGNAEQAQASYRKASEIAPEYLPARLAHARLLGRSEEGYADARRVVSEIRRAMPESPTAFLVDAILRLGHQPDLGKTIAAIQTEKLADAAGSGGLGGWLQLLLAQAQRQHDTRMPPTSLTFAEIHFDRRRALLVQAKAKAPCCDPSFRAELAEEQQQLRLWTDAADAIRAALSFRPADPAYLARAADIFLSMGLSDEAAEQIERLPVRDVMTALRHGRLALARRQYADAERLCRGIVEPPDVYAHAQLCLATALLRQQRGDEGDRVLKPLLACEPCDVSLLVAAAQFYFEQGDYDETEKILGRAGDVVDADRLELTVRLALGRHRVAQAEETLKQLLRLYPEHLSAQMILARLALDQGRVEVAATHMEAMPLWSKEQLQRQALWVRVLLAEGNLDAAEEMIRRAEYGGLPSADVAMLQGQLLLARGNAREAIRLLDQAVRLAPDSLQARVALGQAYRLAGLLDDAYDAFHVVLKYDGDHPHALLELGQIALGDQEVALAVTHLRHALDSLRDRNGSPELVVIGRAQLARAYLRQGSTRQAVGNINAAVATDPRQARAQYHLGLALAEQGDGGRAIALFERVLAQKLPPPETAFHLGRAYAEKNETAKAVAQYRAYLKQYPQLPLANQARKELKRLTAGSESR